MENPFSRLLPLALRLSFIEASIQPRGGGTLSLARWPRQEFAAEEKLFNIEAIGPRPGKLKERDWGRKDLRRATSANPLASLGGGGQVWDGEPSR